MIIMVRIFKMADSEEIVKNGYIAKYIADVEFGKKLDSGGFILVAVQPGVKSEPHAHEKLEEVFVILSDLIMVVDSISYQLEKGDVVIVAPNEYHSFEALPSIVAQILAIKLPNLKDDKIDLNS